MASETTLGELVVSSLPQTDALTKLLIEKGISTQQEFCRRYRKIGQRINGWSLQGDDEGINNVFASIYFSVFLWSVFSQVAADGEEISNRVAFLLQKSLVSRTSGLGKRSRTYGNRVSVSSGAYKTILPSCP